MSTPVGSAQKPLGYSYLISEEMLHSFVPADPAAPYLPAPEVYDDFVFAMGIGWPDAMYAGQDASEVPIQQTVVGRGGLFAGGLQRSGTTDPERKPGWTYNVPAGTSVRALTAKAFTSIRANGPIPVDQEDGNLTWGNWSPSDKVTKERRIFWYQTTVSHSGDDADFDLMMTIYGYASEGSNAGQWIWPEKDGETVPGMKHDPANPNNWISTFDLYRWATENGDLIQQAILLIASIAICVVTFGVAIPAMAGVYIAFQAVLAGMKMLAVAIQTGDVGLAFKAIVKVGQGMYGVSTAVAPADTQNAVDDIKKKFSTEAASFEAWGKSFAAPIAKAYDQVQATISQGGDQVAALIDIASKQARNFPVIDDAYWKNAFAKVNVGGAVQIWAMKAQNIGKDQLNNFINSVPWYAREAAGVGAAVRAAEIAQSEIPIGGGYHFGSIVPAYDPRAPSFIQLKPELAALVRATWPAPDASLKDRAANLAAFVKSPGNNISLPQYSSASTATKNVVIGGLAGATVLYFFRDYIFGRLLDGVFKK